MRPTLRHETTTARRLPVVTLLLVVVTLVAHAVASIDDGARQQRAMTAMLVARLVYLQHPELGRCPALASFVAPATSGPEARPAHDASYDAACAELTAALDGLVQNRFGYVPVGRNLRGLVTYVLVHADWLHVLGNMAFLLLCGRALEDRWGRLPFALYYVASGVAAALVHQLLTRDPGAALVGASGAVAGVMGAFAVLLARAEVRFGGARLLRPLAFEAPAHVVLPLWIVVEVALGLLGAPSGTAHWAHVGGFAFGVTVAMALRTAGAGGSGRTWRARRGYTPDATDAPRDDAEKR